MIWPGPPMPELLGGTTTVSLLREDLGVADPAEALAAGVERGDEPARRRPAGGRRPRTRSRRSRDADSVPWLEPAMPITSSTIRRVSGQKRSDQRVIMPPWLWPSVAIGRPAMRWTLRIA